MTNIEHKITTKNDNKTPTIHNNHALLSVKDITVDYGKNDSNQLALKGVSLDIYKSEFLIVLGKSGCGKTTLLNVIGSLLTPKSGEVIYKNENILKYSYMKKLKYRRNVVSYVFQKFNLIPDLTVKENIMLAAEGSKTSEKYKEIIKTLDIENYENQYPKNMSGGQQQRVCIARAIMKNSEILLCDEPTGALDTKNSFNIVKILQSLSADFGKTVFMITHNPEYVKYSDRYVNINDGQIERITVNDNKVII